MQNTQYSPETQSFEGENRPITARFRVDSVVIERGFYDDDARALRRLVEAGSNGAPIDSVPFAETLTLRNAGIKIRRFMSDDGARVALEDPATVAIANGARRTIIVHSSAHPDLEIIGNGTPFAIRFHDRRIKGAPVVSRVLRGDAANVLHTLLAAGERGLLLRRVPAGTLEHIHSEGLPVRYERRSFRFNRRKNRGGSRSLCAPRT